MNYSDATATELVKLYPGLWYEFEKWNTETSIRLGEKEEYRHRKYVLNEYRKFLNGTNTALFLLEGSPSRDEPIPPLLITLRDGSLI